MPRSSSSDAISHAMQPALFGDGRLPKTLWEKVAPDTSGCWIWTASRTRAGYGHFRRQGKNYLAHRVFYGAFVGELVPGLQVDHRCHVRACVNPSHLGLVTRKQNGENRAGNEARNTSGYRGVTWHRRARKWGVQVVHNGESHWGGLFVDREEAAAAAVALRNSLFTNNLLDRHAAP